MRTPFKMNGFSGFGNSPLKDHKKDKSGNVIKHPKLPTLEAHSTSVAPVIEPVVGELVDPHTYPEGYGYKAEKKSLKRKKKKKKKKNIGEELRRKYAQ